MGGSFTFTGQKTKMNGIEYNYCALAICILTNCLPEHAFARLDNKNTKVRLSEQDTEDMIELKKTMTYQKIADIYGVSADTVCRRVKKYKGTAAS